MITKTKQELVKLDKNHFIHPTSSIKQQQEHGPAYIFTEGEGIYLKDIDGRKMIDARSSLWNVNIGHGRKELAKVAEEQMSKLAFSSTFTTWSHEPVIHLAEKLVSILPDSLTAVFFTSGGSESNDSAIKLARHYWRLKGKPERKKVISRKQAYHGVSAGATSATGITEFWDMAGLLVPDFIHAETPFEIDTKEAISSIQTLIEEEGPETIAAFIAEPIQGAGGVIIPPEDYLGEIRRICDKYDILFIADEVITGFGRTGKMFGLENWDVVPDMLTMAKGITSGYIPLGAVAVSEEIHQVLKERSRGTLFHGFTYSGHPVACAVAMKNIEIIENEQLVDNSRKMGELMLKAFRELRESIDIVGDVRAVGLLGAIEFVEDQSENRRFSPSLKVSAKIANELAKRNVLSRAITYGGTDTIAFAPPLIINEQQIKTMVEALHDSIVAVKRSLTY